MLLGKSGTGSKPPVEVAMTGGADNALGSVELRLEQRSKRDGSSRKTEAEDQSDHGE